MKNKNNISVYLNDDYSGLNTNKHEFYYGYESADYDENKDEYGEWKFIVKIRDTSEIIFEKTTSELEKHSDRLSEPVDYLLAGIGLYMNWVFKNNTK